MVVVTPWVIYLPELIVRYMILSVCVNILISRVHLHFVLILILKLLELRYSILRHFTAVFLIH